MTEEKQAWEIERDKRRKIRMKAVRSMTPEQIQAVHDTYEALNSAVLTIRDLNDIKALDDACHNLYHEFNLGGDDG